MGLWERAASVWQEAARQYVHGWVPGDGPGDEVEPGEGKHYLQVRVTAMSLRFSRQHLAGRSPVLQSAIRWPVGDGQVTVSQTLDRSRFAPAGGPDDGPDFDVYQVHDLALCGDLPLNGGDVEVDVALLAAPSSSLLDRATGFLDDLASLTMVPQLSAAAPVAARIAGGVDQLLGNDDVAGVLAFATSVAAASPRSGFYLVTDVPATGTEDLARYAVRDGTLLHWDDAGQRWQPASGFSHLLLEFRVSGPKPTRWTQLPEITGLSQDALQRLAQATTPAEVGAAGSQLRIAAMKALYSPDLTNVDRDAAAQALVDQWRAQVARLAEVLPMPGQDAAREPAAGTGTAAAVVSAAARLGDEVDGELGALRADQVGSAARERAAPGWAATTRWASG